MRTQLKWLGLLASLPLFLLGCLGGDVERTIGIPCEFSVECAPGLVCHYDRCRVTCLHDADCDAGAACIRGSDGSDQRICTIPVEQGCREHECPTLLSCGSDEICRERCVVDQDCAGDRRCDNQVCIES